MDLFFFFWEVPALTTRKSARRLVARVTLFMLPFLFSMRIASSLRGVRFGHISIFLLMNQLLQIHLSKEN